MNAKERGEIDMSDKKKIQAIDYSNPPMLKLTGREGARAFVKILLTPRSNYDAKKEAEKAADNLRKQGMFV